MPNTQTHTARKVSPKSRAALQAINAERQAKAAARTKPAKSYRNTGTAWKSEDVRELKKLAQANTPTRVIGLKLGRTEASIRDKAKVEAISLLPINRSPYNRTSKSRRGSSKKRS